MSWEVEGGVVRGGRGGRGLVLRLTINDQWPNIERFMQFPSKICRIKFCLVRRSLHLFLFLHLLNVLKQACLSQKSNCYSNHRMVLKLEYILPC